MNVFGLSFVFCSVCSVLCLALCGVLFCFFFDFFQFDVSYFVHMCVSVCVCVVLLANVCPMIISVAILRALLLLPFLFLLFFSQPGGRLLPADTVDLCLYKLLLSVNVLLLCSSCRCQWLRLEFDNSVKFTGTLQMILIAITIDND